ncbi:MAG: hypothetical protein RLZZ387_1367 [Chloroflexota bacterium]
MSETDRSVPPLGLSAAEPAAGAAPHPFPSLAALRAAHADLLKRAQREGYTPELCARAADLIKRGTAAGAILDDDSERDAAQSLLDYWSTILIRAGYEPPDSTLEEFDPNEAPEIPDDACPYLGLDPFNERDQNTFYGRRRLVEWLVQKLESQPLLALVGPSGSGKSSVIRAGLLPALKDGALLGSAEWRYVPPFTPGPEPLLSLARQLRRRLGIRLPAESPSPAASSQPAEESAAIARRLREDPAWLLRALDETGGAPAVLFIDQFEELYTLCEDEGARQAFVDGLLALLEPNGSRHLIVLTMRSDFESFIATSPALQAWFERTRVQLMPLNASELREAIEKPAELVGLKFEPGVVDALLHDMLGEPAALPLLQFTLLKLWEQRDRNRVTWESYRRVGGGRLALARSADAFYNSLLPEDQVTARRILLRIVRPGEGLEITSNPVRRDVLYQGGEARDRVDRVLEKLVQARLLRLTEGDTLSLAQVELAHEALVRNWPTLVQWLEDERSAVATRRRLEAKAAEWVRLGRGSAGLLDESQLVEAERWLVSAEAAYLGYAPALAELTHASAAAIEEAERQRREAEQRELRQARELAESRWIQAEQNRQLAEALSVQKAQAEQLARAAQVQAEQAEKLADTQRGAALRARALAVALAVACGVAIAFSILAIQQAFTADQQRQVADRERAAASEAQFTAVAAAQTSQAQSVELQTAEAGSRESARAAATSEALAIANQATAVAERARATQGERAATSGRLAAEAQAVFEQQPQLSLLLASEGVNVARQTDPPLDTIADDTLRGQLARVGGQGLVAPSGPIRALAVSRDGATLVTGAEDGAVLVWDLAASGAPSQSLSAPAPVTMLELSPDGRWLATAGEDADTPRLWDLRGAGAAPRELTGHGGAVTDMDMSADGRFVATSSEDGTVRVWSTQGTAAPAVLAPRSRRSPLRAVALSADGQQIVAGGADGVSRLWRLSDPGSAFTTSDPRGALTTAAIAPNGRWFVTGSVDGDAHLWQIADGRFVSTRPEILRGRGNGITTVAVSPDSSRIAYGTRDGTVRLWQVEGGQSAAAVSELRGHTGAITALAFAPDSLRLLTASQDNTARLWDLSLQDPGTQALLLRGHEGSVNAAAISAEGSPVAVTGSGDGTARVWELARPLPQEAQLPADQGELLGLACAVAGRSMTAAEWERYLPGVRYRETCP